MHLESNINWQALCIGSILYRVGFLPSTQIASNLLGGLIRFSSVTLRTYEKDFTARSSHTTSLTIWGRLIFVQFLFQRTDSSGNAALNASVLNRLFDERVFRKQHDDLGSILSDHGDSYRFFRWLNERFNGDLFPGKGETATQQEREWQQEIKAVQPLHLDYLSEFVRGSAHFDSGQRSLFPLYSFDTIPLEFISSIYEEFVSGGAAPVSAVHYTPGHLVDLILDGVLPWEDEQWNIQVLDPACGSGIFLVKSFQRLIHR